MEYNIKLSVPEGNVIEFRSLLEAILAAMTVTGKGEKPAATSAPAGQTKAYDREKPVKIPVTMNLAGDPSKASSKKQIGYLLNVFDQHEAFKKNPEEQIKLIRTLVEGDVEEINTAKNPWVLTKYHVGSVSELIEAIKVRLEEGAF